MLNPCVKSFLPSPPPPPRLSGNIRGKNVETFWVLIVANILTLGIPSLKNKNRKFFFSLKKYYIFFGEFLCGLILSIIVIRFSASVPVWNTVSALKFFGKSKKKRRNRGKKVLEIKDIFTFLSLPSPRNIVFVLPTMLYRSWKPLTRKILVPPVP